MSRKSWETYFEAVKKQDWIKAKNALTEIAASEKGNPQVYLKMGDVCQRAGDTASAVKAYHVSARIQYLEGFHHKAVALYKIILRLDPDNAEALAKTEGIVKEVENARGQHFVPVSAAVAEPAVLPEPSPELQEKVPPAAESPSAADSGPDQAGWLAATAYSEPGSAAGKIGHADEAVIGSSGPVWLEATSHAAEVPPDAPVSDGLAAAEEHSAAGEGSAGAGGEEAYIPSMDEIFSELPDESFQKMLDDLVVPLSERNYIASDIPELFSGMSQAEYDEVLHGFSSRIVCHGEPVIEEGDTGDSMYIVKSGVARVVAHMVGREIELAQLGPGDLFGEVAFLTGRPRTASVLAAGTLEVYEIGRADIESLIERNPEILSRLESFHERRVQETVRKILPR